MTREMPAIGEVIALTRYNGDPCRVLIHIIRHGRENNGFEGKVVNGTVGVHDDLVGVYCWGHAPETDNWVTVDGMTNDELVALAKWRLGQ